MAVCWIRVRGTVFLRAEAMTSRLLSGARRGAAWGRGCDDRTNPQARCSRRLSAGIIKHECCQHRSGHDLSLQFVPSRLLGF